MKHYNILAMQNHVAKTIQGILENKIAKTFNLCFLQNLHTYIENLHVDG